MESNQQKMRVKTTLIFLQDLSATSNNFPFFNYIRLIRNGMRQRTHLGYFHYRHVIFFFIFHPSSFILHFVITPNLPFKILAHAKPLASCRVDIRKANGLVLASPIRCPDDLPRFDNSAMDGYAVRSLDVRDASKANPVLLRLIGEVHAGSSKQLVVKKGLAVRIATGAPVPTGADAVVMQEYCECEGPLLRVHDAEPHGGNIRRRGEEIRRGQIALKKGHPLNPGSIAWLATMGVKTVAVHRPPRVGLLRSGTEVVEWGRAPRVHQVRDAHGISLPLALQKMGFDVEIPAIVRDDLDQTIRAFSRLLKACDLVITTGGVSVGARDLFHAAAQTTRLKTIFHKVSQKPGKPMVFAKRGTKLWFGLPGNPVASLVCFYLYVKPCLHGMMGHPHVEPEWFGAKTAESFHSNPRRTDFLRGHLEHVTFAESRVPLPQVCGRQCSRQILPSSRLRGRSHAA